MKRNDPAPRCRASRGPTFYDGAVSEEKKKHTFLTIDEVAEELNVSVAQARALLKVGELQGLQVGRRNVWRIGAADVEDYIPEAYKRTAKRIAADDLPD